MRHLTIGNARFVVFGDTHIPFEDKDALYMAEHIAEKIIKPDIAIYNGDALDCYALSKFSKDPARISGLQNELDQTHNMLQRHRRKFGSDTKMFLLLGNHCNRLQKYLWSRAPELSKLRCLELGELLGLPKLNIEMIPYEEGLLINKNLLIIHGDIASVHSGYTAKRLYEKHGGCGICNHTHRGGSFYKRNRFDTYGWWENFCLCDLNPDYITNPNWLHGFTAGVIRKGLFHLTPTPIIDNKCLFGNMYFHKGKKEKIIMEEV